MTMPVWRPGPQTEPGDGELEEQGTSEVDTALEDEEGEKFNVGIPLPSEVPPPDHAPGAMPPVSNPLDSWVILQGDMAPAEASADVGDA